MVLFGQLAHIANDRARRPLWRPLARHPIFQGNYHLELLPGRGLEQAEAEGDFRGEKESKHGGRDEAQKHQGGAAGGLAAHIV